jgi:hypothetical protein
MFSKLFKKINGFMENLMLFIVVFLPGYLTLKVLIHLFN